MVALLGFTLWSGGCGDDDRYYCDSTGCYQCDGYGCKPDPRYDGGIIDAGPGPRTDAGKDASIPPPPVCKYPSDCGPKKSCVNGQCIPTCSGTDPNECGTGYKCENKLCVPEPGRPQCERDDQCPAETPKCYGNVCVKRCTPGSEAAECGEGKYCNPDGACVPDTRPKPNCTTTDTSKCASTQKCVEGYCKYPCQNNATCERIDDRIRFCGVDKVCRTEAEAKALCVTRDDCPVGKSCVDNQCR